jgi:hypothetical protein
MEHEKHPECLVNFERINTTHARIESDLQKMMVAIFGNGRAGLKEETAQLHRDINELREVIFEQDQLLRELRDSRKMEAKSRDDEVRARKSEVLKFILMAGLALLGGMVTFANTYFLWRLTGQLP